MINLRNSLYQALAKWREDVGKEIRIHLMIDMLTPEEAELELKKRDLVYRIFIAKMQKIIDEAEFRA